MITKQNLWFLTLFSLVLVLSIYYITMPNELLLTNNSNKVDNLLESENVEAEVEESSYLVSLQVSLDEERMTLLEKYQNTLANETSSLDEKNLAYEQIKKINELKSQESSLEQKIKEEFNYDSFIKIDGKEIKVIIASSNHNSELANKIMRTIQEEYDTEVYVTVKFSS